ncbi:dUTP diphosphatase [Candidatus Saccharibacteria bacterium]|nr:dUTP diphosphatase [Candidatus Saccharibacteria bacterium]
MNIRIKKVQKNAQLPEYQTVGAAAVDLHACIDESITLPAGKTAIIPTGIAIELPEGVEAQVRARSGFAAKNAIGLANGIGTIDTDYRGEIAAILINWGDHDFVVEPQMRIAQMVIARYETVTWDLVDELTESGRNLKKFGSTGLAS